ncbi:MAG: GNAT family protein [Anaerolineae bacterium]
MTDKPVVFMRGETIYLRPYTMADAELVYRSTFDPEDRKLTGTQVVFSLAAVEAHIERVQQADDRVDMVIALQTNHEAVGEVVLNEVDMRNRNANIRIAMYGSQYTNKGYGTQAMRLMLGYGFYMLNLHRISLGVFAFNDRARHVYEKLGFQQEGVLRDILFYDNAYHDEIVMSILKPEFEARDTP